MAKQKVATCSLPELAGDLMGIVWNIRNDEWGKIDQKVMGRLGKIAANSNATKAYGDLFSSIRRKEQLSGLESMVSLVLDLAQLCK